MRVFRARRSGRSKSSLGMLRREDKHGSGGKVPQKMFSSLGCLQNWRIKEGIAQVIFDLFET